MNLLKEIKKLNLKIGQYVVVGGSALAGYGIRESKDIDILVTSEIYSRFKNEGWTEIKRPNGARVLLKGAFDIGAKWFYGDYNPDPRKLLGEANIVNGVPLVKLEEIIEYKKRINRQKDRKDIILIENYLRSQRK